jgi:hypothetical protein
MDSRTQRIEGISLLYLLFFVLAVLSPSIYQHDYFGIPETTLEEATIFLFGMAGIMTFTWYERLMERRDLETEKMHTEYQKAKVELIESYAYIGSVNRKIELLKKIANDTSLKLAERKRLPKQLLEALAANALAAVGAEAVLIRLMHTPTLRTEAEVSAFAKRAQVFRVANKDLREVDQQQTTHAFVLSEDKRDVLVVPSDARETSTKAYLLLFLPTQTIAEIDVSLLKVLVNQAQMVHRSGLAMEEEAEPVIAQIEAPQAK